MNFEDFSNKYDLIIGDVETIDPNTIRVMFEKRRIFIKEIFSGEILYTGLIIDDIEIDHEIHHYLMHKIFKKDFEK